MTNLIGPPPTTRLAVPSRDRGFSEKTDSQQFTGTGFTDIAGLSLTVVSRGRPYYVTLDIPQVKNNVAVACNITGTLVLSDNTALRQSTFNLASGTTIRGRLLVRHRINDAFGTSRTFKGQMNSNSASGDWTIVESSIAAVSVTLYAEEC